MIIQHSLAPFATLAPYYVSFLIGIVLHLAVFRHGEWHLHSLNLITTALLISSGATAVLTILGPRDGNLAATVAANAGAVAVVLAGCVSGIFGSMLVYRAFMHRLGGFRGPFLARLSSFYITFRACKKHRLFEEIDQLHAQYGDIVRVGPNELSIADPETQHLVFARESRCIKGPWYDMNHPTSSVQITRNPNEHDFRRRGWDKALGTKALREYEPRIHTHTQQLLQEVESSRGKPFDMSKWLQFYTFDVIGNLAFSTRFDTMKHGALHDFCKTIHANVEYIGLFRHLPWAFPLYRAIPGLNSARSTSWKWLIEQVTWRKQTVLEDLDIFSWLSNSFESNALTSEYDKRNFIEELYLAVFAGSDTTAITMTCLCFELARHPDVAAKLRNELHDYFAAHETPDALSLSKAKYLNACIDETLRLYPAIPSGLQRVTPREGLQLGKVYIPGETILHVRTYHLQRDERCFVHPNEFIPERWTTRPELVKNASVMSPFGTGCYACAGRQLALMEIRQVISTIVHQYNLHLAPSQKEEDYLQSLKDFFTIVLPPLEMVFEKVDEKTV
ncbi:hypothetical protein E4U21_006416 [Claviceps maximensis]|nr:hypothetical protein E4U21_006416 [Claviceps maximensis]